MTEQSDVASAGRFDVVTVDPIADARWQALLGTEAAGLFHSPPWLRALSDAYSFELKAHLAVNAANEACGGLVFSVLDDVLGRRIMSAPFSDACDPLLTTPDAWPVLFDQIKKHEAPFHLRCLRDVRLRDDPHMTVTKRARWHTLSVAVDAEAILEGFDASTRRAIRKAERSGVIVRRLEGADGLAAFHDLHVALRKQKYRLLAQPFRFFEAVKRRFEEVDGWFPLGAFLGDQLIAATVYLRWADTLYYKFNASSPGALDMRPNDLLVWAGVSLAKSLGCRNLDLGPSDDDQPGLIRFKAHFGANERELRFLRYVPPGWQDERGERRRLLGEITRLATSPNVPDDVTRDAGALLYPLFA